jgi:hypothetical protein
MKLFLSRLLGLLAILTVSVILVAKEWRPLEGGSDYLDAIIDKHRLAERTGSPRVLLCGGSNLAFGVNSKEIEDAIGVPVVNMGLHAGLGLEFILNEIRAVGRSGDVVVIAVEYFLPMEGDYRLQRRSAQKYLPANAYFRQSYFKDLEKIRDEYQTNLKEGILRGVLRLAKRESVYARRYFNQYGDMVGHLDKTEGGRLRDGGKLEYSEWEGIRYINEYCTWAARQGIRVYWTYPCYARSEYERNRAVIERYSQDINSKLKAPVLLSPEACTFLDKYFYDTVYHLGRAGTEARTAGLIAVLKGILSTGKRDIGNQAFGTRKVAKSGTLGS